MQLITASNWPPEYSPTPQELTQRPTTPEGQLLATVQAATTRELARATTSDIRDMLADMSVGLTRPVALAAPKIFQLTHRFGQATVVKLLVAILRAFVDSLRVPLKPDAADLMELADELARIYTHDSIKDIMLALKEARTSGHNFYQSLDSSTVFAIISRYFEEKARFLENRHLDCKATGAGTAAAAVAQLARAAPAVAQMLLLQHNPADPNQESKRRKLTITKGKEQRGLISKETADEQRRQAAAASIRKDRPDWKPTTEAQKAIDRRHRAEDAHLFEKYRPAALT